MKIVLLLAVSALAPANIPAPAIAQMNMPGMSMPVREQQSVKKRPKAKRKVDAKTIARPSVEKKKRASSSSKKIAGAIAAAPKTHSSIQMPVQAAPSGMSQMPMDQPRNGTRQVPNQASGASSQTVPIDRSPMVNGQTGEMNMTNDQSPMRGMQKHDGGHQMAMTAALGLYAQQRESSGTAWQPDSSRAMGGPMVMAGDWALMAQGTLNLVYDHQSGPRGDSKAFISGMLMGMAQHPLGNGTLQMSAMLSPEPLMGPKGYPLLLASGETANGRDRLIDRQHPHDFFMELSASASQKIGAKSSLFLYAGLPGEPAFGPPTFMDRESIEDSPEAPITHHWLDSTHITFGVITAGLVLDRFKLEASRFNGREPDQHRWNIETGPLDSSSARLSWNPTRTLALQASWAHLVDPEQLEPGVNQTRWSATILWADDVSPGWHAAATLAWGRKSSQGHNDDGYAAEASLKHDSWTVFGRVEMVGNRELIQRQDQPAYKVGKLSAGAVRDFPIAHHLSLGAGGLFSVNSVPDGLAPLYGGHNPTGAMGFVRVKLN